MTTKPIRPRVLLVDDYPDAREMYAEYLEFCGFDVVEAGTGREGGQRGGRRRSDAGGSRNGKNGGNGTHCTCA